MHSDSDLTGAAGIGVVTTKVSRDLRWIFRPVSEHDKGIDGHIEVRNDDKTVHGRMIAVQVKAGNSYLDKSRSEGFRYRPKPRHLRYWLSHSLPVILVLCDASTEECWWQVVSATTVDDDGSMLVPFDQRLDESARFDLQHVARGLQPRDVVLPLVKIWLAERSGFEIRWATIEELPRDWHGSIELFDLRGEISSVAILFDDGSGFNLDELSRAYEEARYNYRVVTGLRRLLVAFVSERNIYPQLPEPPSAPSGTFRIQVEYAVLRLENSWGFELTELAPDGSGFEDDRWAHSAEDDRARRSAQRPRGFLSVVPAPRQLEYLPHPESPDAV